MNLTKIIGCALEEAVNHENDEINKIIRRTVGKKDISDEDAKVLADAGITRKEDGTLVGPNGRELSKQGRTFYGPSHNYKKQKPTTLVSSNGTKKRYPGCDIDTPGWRPEKRQPFDTNTFGNAKERFNNKVDLKGYLDKVPGENTWKTKEEIDAALRPYSKDYLGDKYLLDDDRLAPDARKRMDDIVAKAKAKHPGLYESLNFDLPGLDAMRELMDRVGDDHEVFFELISWLPDDMLLRFAEEWLAELD